MIDYEGMVRAFAKKYKHHIGDTTIPPYDVIKLRRKLIKEEAKELTDAINAVDLEKIADGIADLLYVTFGAAISFGIPIGAIFKEVHRSNMTKSTLKNDLGKTMKGPHYDPPNLKRILRGEGLKK